MDILFFEIKKNFLKPSILICILVFSMINIFKITVGYDSFLLTEHHVISPHTGYEKIYAEKLSGKLTDEKVNFVRGYYKELLEETSKVDHSTEYDKNRYTGYLFGDLNLIKRYVIPLLEYNYMYSSNMVDVLDKANDNVKLYSNLGNKYEKAKNNRVAEMYKNRKIEDTTNNRGISYYFRYDFSALLVILLLIFGLSTVFCNENETQMVELIRTSKNRKKTVTMKFLASFIYVFAISLYFYLMDLILIYMISGTDSFFVPIYSVPFFELTPLNMSVIAFIFLDFVMNFMVFTLLGIFLLYISYYLKRTVNSIVFGIIAISGLIMANDFFKTVLNPVSLITNYSMVRNFEGLNVFGICILNYEAAIIVSVSYFFVLCLFIRKQAIKWY